MKNKFTIFYTIFAALAFVFAISFFGLNLYKEYSYGEISTSKKFNNIVTDLDTISKNPNLTTNSLVNDLKKSLGSFNDYAFIKITINDVEILKYPANQTLEATKSSLTKTYEKSFSSQAGTFKIVSNLYLLRPSSIYYYGKVAFLIILAITLLTVVIIIYMNTHGDSDIDSPLPLEVKDHVVADDIVASDSANVEIKETKEENLAQEAQAQVQVQQVEENPVQEKTQEEKSEEEKNLEEKKLEEKPLEVKEEEKNPQEENPQTETEKIPDAEPVELPSQEVKPMELNNQAQSDSPAGLFNPVTGFGWEQYLLTRLESEINRAIASEIDFSIFIIQLPLLSRDSEMVKNVCNYLAIQFQFKDLLFEYKDDCLVAMKISMDLDEALNFADKIYTDIKNIIEDNKCYIGISTRSIRMVSGERLLNEASQALIHAKDDEDSPIIAFRVDAEKYRQFLEGNKD